MLFCRAEKLILPIKIGPRGRDRYTRRRGWIRYFLEKKQNPSHSARSKGSKAQYLRSPESIRRRAKAATSLSLRNQVEWNWEKHFRLSALILVRFAILKNLLLRKTNPQASSKLAKLLLIYRVIKVEVKYTENMAYLFSIAI